MEKSLMDEQSELQIYYVRDLVSPGAGTGAGAAGVAAPGFSLGMLPPEQEPTPGY